MWCMTKWTCVGESCACFQVFPVTCRVQPTIFADLLRVPILPFLPSPDLRGVRPGGVTLVRCFPVLSPSQILRSTQLHLVSNPLRFYSSWYWVQLFVLPSVLCLQHSVYIIPLWLSLLAAHQALLILIRFVSSRVFVPSGANRFCLLIYHLTLNLIEQISTSIDSHA